MASVQTATKSSSDFLNLCFPQEIKWHILSYLAWPHTWTLPHICHAWCTLCQENQWALLTQSDNTYAHIRASTSTLFPCNWSDVGWHTSRAEIVLVLMARDHCFDIVDWARSWGCPLLPWTGCMLACIGDTKSIEWAFFAACLEIHGHKIVWAVHAKLVANVKWFLTHKINLLAQEAMCVALCWGRLNMANTLCLHVSSMDEYNFKAVVEAGWVPVVEWAINNVGHNLFLCQQYVDQYISYAMTTGNTKLVDLLHAWTKQQCMHKGLCTVRKEHANMGEMCSDYCTAKYTYTAPLPSSLPPDLISALTCQCVGQQSHLV